MVIEPERTLLLSEKGAADEQFVVAEENFRFFGTMNPGGDFGKKEVNFLDMIYPKLLFRHVLGIIVLVLLVEFMVSQLHLKTIL